MIEIMALAGKAFRDRQFIRIFRTAQNREEVIEGVRNWESSGKTGPEARRIHGVIARSRDFQENMTGFSPGSPGPVHVV